MVSFDKSIAIWHFLDPISLTLVFGVISYFKNKIHFIQRKQIDNRSLNHEKKFNQIKRCYSLKFWPQIIFSFFKFSRLDNLVACANTVNNNKKTT